MARYKLGGTVTGEFWHVVATCRFEPGDMDLYLPEIRHIASDAEFRAPQRDTPRT